MEYELKNVIAERKTKTVRNGKEIEVSKRFKIYKLAGV